MRAFRAAHDTPERASLLRRIEEAARGSENLMPCILAAVKAGATVGQISDGLRGVWGEHKETLTI